MTTKWQNLPLPSCLHSRKGWAQLFELQRSPEPHLHQIEPTNHCPYSCIMCPRAKFMVRPQGFMDFDLYQKVISEVAGYAAPVRNQEIELFHFGESLLHPQIAAMVGYASRKRLKTVLSVNAPELSPEIAEGLLRNQPHKIIISLDGFDDESYRKIRGENADYQKAVQRIDAFIQLYSRYCQATQLQVRMIRLHMNENHTDEFISTWEKKGIHVELRDFFPWTRKDMVGLGRFEQYPPYMPCPFPWKYLVVQWNGDVVPCCRDYNGVNKLGNVNDESLQEIWNGSAYKAFRDGMASGALESSLCAECMAIYYTEQID
jgi:radical SAM protein with 4Fe4S-binding SPASM domain